jgi:hypothetical protein
MTMKGGETCLDWDALAPHIEHETRESIVEALRRLGPLSAPDLKHVIGDSALQLAYIRYHLMTLVGAEALVDVGGRHAGASVETLYYFPIR